VIIGAVFTVNATRVDVAAGLHVPLTTTSKPTPANAASPTCTPLIVNVAVVEPLYVEPLPVDPSTKLTPFFLH
jgi:hypothetical protein